MQYMLHYTAHVIKICDHYIAGALVGGVSALSVLLFMSVTINILAMIYCVYQLRGKLTQCHCVSGGDGDNVEQTYEQVDEKHHHTRAVAMKRNEAYGEISSSSSPTTRTVL